MIFSIIFSMVFTQMTLGTDIETAKTIDAELELIGGQWVSDFEKENSPISSLYSGIDAELDDNAVIIRLKNIDEFLQYVDLRHAHHGAKENGSIAVFIASPNSSTVSSETGEYTQSVSDALLSGKSVNSVTPKNVMDSIGHFVLTGTEAFKEGVSKELRITRIGPRNGYPCGTYRNRHFNLNQFCFDLVDLPSVKISIVQV